MSTVQRRSTQGKAGELSYLSWPGQGDRTPILFLHPVNTAAAIWSLVAAALRAGEPGSQPPAVAVDYRAHGGSEAGGPFFPADYASDALAVLDACEIDRAHVVSGSIGGAVAAELAAVAGERVASIAAFGATLGLNWAKDALTEMEQSLRALGVREWFVAHGAAIFGPGSRPEAPGELTELATTGRDGDRDLDTVIELTLTTFGFADGRPAAEKVLARAERPPARVFVGTHDPTCPPAMARELAAALGGDLRILEGIGHLPMIEDPAGTAAGIAEFIARVER